MADAEHHLPADQFLTKLRELFAATTHENHSRSVFLTQKRLTPKSAEVSSDPLSDLAPATPFNILIRATNGKWKEEKSKKVKISTVVQEKDLEAFFGKYAEVCKTGMTGLKKRDRGAQKAKLKAKKEKERERKAREEKAG